MFEIMLDGDQHRLPGDLENIPTGPFLGAILSAIDVTALNGHDAVRFMKAAGRMESYFTSKRLAATAEVAFSPQSGPDADVVRDSEELEFASVEVAAALHKPRRAAERDVDLALGLANRMRQVLEAMHRGRIDLARAKVIEYETSGVGEATAREVIGRIIEPAPGLTTGELRARIQRLVLEVDPDSAEKRYEEAVLDRKLVTEANPDGTANLKGFSLPPNRTTTAMARVHSISMRLKQQGDQRSLDQIRADVFLDLLNGKGHVSAAPGGLVDIYVDLETLAEMADMPGELAGYGPVVADIARQVAAEQQGATWRFTVTDSENRPVHLGTTRRRPTAAMRQLIESRHRGCIHPGCRMPATQCDLDHTIPVADGGPTCVCSMVPLCRHHHRARHDGGWRYLKDEVGYRWVSPLAHHYTTSGRSP